MQTRDELIVAARTLKNYLGMGTPIGEALRDLAEIQKKYHDHWSAIAAKAEGGARLADEIEAHGLWPESMVAAVRAGEESNSIEAVLQSIVVFNVNMKQIIGEISKKIITPCIFIVVGILIFIGFMAFVLPGIAKPLKPRDRTGLVAVSDWFVMIMNQHLIEAAAIVVTSIVGLVLLFRNKEVQLQIMQMIDRVPGLGHGMREMYFGFWLGFMSILDAAGDIAYQEMVRISSLIIPRFYQQGMQKLLDEASAGRELIDAVDDRRWEPGDPRLRWPKMFRGVLRQSAALGKIKDAFDQASGPMIEEGVIKLQKTLYLFNLIAMGVAAGGILTPLAGMMLVQLDVVNKMK